MRQDTYGGRGKGRRVAAHYQVTDLVIRRDWYSLANVFASHEVSEADMSKVASLLESVSLDELVLLDTQLQLVGLSRVKSIGDIAKDEPALVVASGLELSRRRYYLRQECARDPSLEVAYRRRIKKVLQSGMSYQYASKDTGIALRATHRMMELLRRQTIDEEERSRALTVILRRDPQLLVSLVDDGYVSLGEASDYLEASSIAPIDAIRLLVAIPELLTKDRVAAYSDYLDLGAIAQLRDETSEQVVVMALSARAVTLLEGAVQVEAAGASRYGGLYGSEYTYAAGRQGRLRTSLTELTIELVRDAIESIDESNLLALSKIPSVKKYDAAEALLFVEMLGERFEWASEFAEKMSKEYARQWLTGAQRLVQLDDKSSLLDGNDRMRIDRLNTELSRLSFQLDISALEVARYAPHVKKLINTLIASKAMHRSDLMTIAYLAPSDKNLCTQVARRLDDQVCGSLLSAAIDGSSLARGFWQALSVGDLLYLLLRWGNRTRNGYVLWLLADVSKRRYATLCREVESRKLPSLTLAEVSDALEVLAQSRHNRDAIPSEQCLEFADQLAKTYGLQLAARFVHNLGVRHAKELERFSPFYVRLLIDMQGDLSAITQLKGKETSLTYEQAQEFRAAYFAQTRSFAKDVVVSMQRNLGRRAESSDDAAVLGSV